MMLPPLPGSAPDIVDGGTRGGRHRGEDARKRLVAETVMQLLEDRVVRHDERILDARAPGKLEHAAQRRGVSIKGACRVAHEVDAAGSGGDLQCERGDEKRSMLPD